jgi:ABC-type transport system involved in cytochrome c biogenesis permease subunit
MSLQTSLREAALRVEEARKNIANVDDTKVAELLAKTVYPDSGKMLREYNYTRFAPFYWMFIFGAISVVLGLVSYFWGIIRRTVAMPETYSIQTTEDVSSESPQERPDYTNSVEELFHSASVFVLFAAVFVTFIGGVLRARISGWAPVTNMYETVVFTAFCAGLFGIWYSLYPLLQPVLQLGWQYTCFPSLKSVFKIFFGRKPEVQRIEHESSGEFAIRQAVADFGLPDTTVSTPHYADETSLETDRQEQMTRRKLFWQTGLMLPRLLLMFAVFYFVVILCNGHDAAENGFFAAAASMFAANDMIDALTIAVSVALIVWYVPHIILTFIPVPVIFLHPRLVASELGILSYTAEVSIKVAAATAKQQRSELGSVFTGEHGTATAAVPADTSGAAWLKLARNNILDRKLFTVIAAAVLVAAGLTAYLNTAQFNPEIRPIAAVLRSNFWLTVHVVTIVLSYAAAFVAWGMSVVALGNIVFGRFQAVGGKVGERASAPAGKDSARASAPVAKDSARAKALPLTSPPLTDSIAVELPPLSALFAPVIEKLLKISLLFLVLGTVLGARWADYSWGRFWSWDPKEVWALITIMFYVIVLHGVIARWYGKIGVIVGALFASIAVIITWYGINYVFKGSMHSYGNGSSDNAVLFLGVFIVANILWGSLAVLRYTAETYGKETPK